MLTALGVLIISPDGLLTRLVTADSLTLTYWRGLYFGYGMTFLLLLIYRTKTLSLFLSIGIPGLMMIALYSLGNISFIYSITHTSVANTLFILSSTPLFAALISWLFLRERIGLRTGIAIVAAAIGIYIIFSGPGVLETSTQGNFAGLVGSMLLAGSFVVVRQNKSRNLMPALALGGICNAMLLSPMVSIGNTSESDLVVLFVMGFVMLPLAMTLMFIVPKYIPTPEVGLMLLLESILGPLWVWIVLGENPGTRALVGGAIVLATLAINSIWALLETRAAET